MAPITATSTWAIGPSPARARERSLDVQSERVNPITRWAFYAFVLSLPFEYPNRSIPIEVTTLTGAIFLLTTVLNPRVCYGRVTAALGCFLAFLFAFVASYAVNGADFPAEVTRHFLTMLQLVLIMWASSNLMRRDSIARGVLLALAAACTARALIQVLGIASVPAAVGSGVHRQSALGQNANLSANIMAVGFLALVGLAYLRERGAIKPRMLTWPFAGLIGLAIVQTGSRGGLLALAVGLVAFAMAGRTIGTRVRNAVVVVLVMGFFGYVAATSEVMKARFDKAKEGNMAGREAIFPVAWQMFLERPVIGWGPASNKYELARRLPEQQQDRRDPHNLWLEVLTLTGVIGGIPFCIGLLLCFGAAWSGRRGANGMLAVAMMSTVLVGNLSGNYIASKLLWLTLAFALASASNAVAPPMRLS
jgi:O-antigen ligase